MQNIIELQGPTLEPKDQIKKLVIFLHGYGSNGNDLISLTEGLYKSLPNTAFVSPNAPFGCDENPMGYQWFPLSQPRTYESCLQGSITAAPHLNAFIDAQKQLYHIQDKDIALIGFSQGTMISLYIAPRRQQAFAAVIGLSGLLPAIEELATETISRPPILLIHGDQDDVLPHALMAEAEQNLTKNGFNVTTHTSKGVGHGVAPDGIDLTREFLVKHLLN